MEQWLGTDIRIGRVMEKSALPLNLLTWKARKLRGSFVLMVVTPSDRTQAVDSSMVLTDGFTMVKVLETRPTPQPWPG